MSTETDDERLVQRISELAASDPQFAAAMPSDEVTARAADPELRLPEAVQTILDGYAERPALAYRAVDFTEDDAGRTVAKLLPRFDTITYGELSDRARALSSALSESGVEPGDRVAILGFTSADYTTIDIALLQLGAVSVPLQTSSSLDVLGAIVEESAPTLLAAGVDYLDAAAELAPGAGSITRLIAFDYLDAVDDHRDAVAATRDRLATTDAPIAVETLNDALQRGRDVPSAPKAPTDEPDPLALLIYTSGSTGAPKGAMYLESGVGTMWRRNVEVMPGPAAPSITLSFMPMSHVMGRFSVFSTLGAGGTCYFAARSDLSTLLEDLPLTRPTGLIFVPRVWEMLHDEFNRRLEHSDADPADIRADLLGERYTSAVTGSAPISGQLKGWVESVLEIHVRDGYGSTEAGVVIADGEVQRPPVIDYKLVDVPDLGYFHTDQPHPRGELLLKTETMFPGYYKRPELTADVFDEDGFYRTGDIVAELEPDHLQYVDRRNNVLKLAQGEFVTVAKLEAAFGNSPLIRQIYVYGNSARPYLLAVIVPTESALNRYAPADLRTALTESLQQVAKTAQLQSYEVPRDFIVENAPFTQDNGLLTGIGKLAWPKLKAHYGDRLEKLYEELADAQARELRELRRDGADAPVLETVGRAAAALLGASAADVRPDAQFTDLGGDSLSALTFGNLLREIFDVEVPVGVLVSPANDLAAIAGYIESERSPDGSRPTFASVHGDDATEIRAAELTLDKFLDEETLSTARSLPRADARVRTVLLTGATGFLGRYLALEWLERMDLVDGKVIVVVRGKDDASARRRLDATFDGPDTELSTHYRELAADHLEVLAGDKGQADLGLDGSTWQRLADTVDLIVDPAALVNHVLPYRELFGPNVLGTAELIRLALTTKIKPYTYISTVGVGDQIAPGAFAEEPDIRTMSAVRRIDDSYANGYGNSKWAGEVLLREAHDLCDLPVAVFRSDMILADDTYSGQLNLPDMFTRLLFSVVATGSAPASFYELDSSGNRQRAHFDGLPVAFVAESVSTLGAQAVESYETYHVMNPHDDGIGLDTYVDWLIEAGSTIRRIPAYDEWIRRFESSLRGLPDKQRQASLLPLIHNYQRPSTPMTGSFASTEHFRGAVQNAKIGPDKDIPHVTPEIIGQYVTNLRQLGLL